MPLGASVEGTAVADIVANDQPIVVGIDQQRVLANGIGKQTVLPDARQFNVQWFELPGYIGLGFPFIPDETGNTSQLVILKTVDERHIARYNGASIEEAVFEVFPERREQPGDRQPVPECNFGG